MDPQSTGPPVLQALALLALLFTLGSCRASGESRSATSAWSPSFEPPLSLETERVRLEPLAERHAALDYAALMGSREHLRRTLHWGDWPRPDFTLEENRADLARHQREFERHEAYAYTVLAPERSRCLGCVYLNPAGEEDPRSAYLSFWVIEETLVSDLDRHLLDALLRWVERSFPLDTLLFLAHVDDTRRARMLDDSGLEERASQEPSTRVFRWRRAPR